MLKKVLDISSIVLWLISIILIMINYVDLPDKIPSHYNFAGDADAWSTKTFIFFMPVLGLLIWLMLHYLVSNPKLDKYIHVPSLYGQPNKAQIENAKLLIYFIKFEMMALFTFLVIKDLYTALGMPFKLGVWETIIILSVIGVTIIIFMARNYMLDKNENTK
ncbi:DUF1648 domain-containing protein [Mammaliicoccus sciuri]|uniref:DUF1648 domain-containing protein n=1 Tax=Mammaliicoccus sciuri TaxID=1296 RepID=UPI0021D1361F|nr:DUF1648 domain-containing protein [Mammaliicoccus sciuri]UXV32773.1 DUF1648 domain-containing protein [Mammaliicoccus sciuri]